MDRERVLVLLAAGVDALVTEDALAVVADVELVVDLDGLVDGRRGAAVRLDVVARAGAIAILGRRRRRAEALGLGVVPPEVAGGDGCRREVDRRGEQLEHELPGETHALRVRLHLHPRFDLPGAGRGQDTRTFDLDHAHAAGVRGLERLAVAERRGLDPERRARSHDRGALEDPNRLPVDLELDHPLRSEKLGHAEAP